jgi:hypothetical protein
MKKVSDYLKNLIPPFTPCANCKDGWVMAECKLESCMGNISPQKHEHLTRCSCFRAHQQRIVSGLKGKV